MRTVATLLVSLLFLPHSTPASFHSEPTSDDYDPDDYYVLIRYPIIWDIKDINISAVVDAAAKQTEEEVYRAAGLPPPAHPFPYPRLLDPETAEYKPLPVLPDDWVSVSPSQLVRLQELRALTPQPPTDPVLLAEQQDLEKRLVSRVKFLQQLPKPLKDKPAADLAKLLPLLPDKWLKLTPGHKQRLQQLLRSSQPLTDPQQQEELRVLQRRLHQRILHLQQLEQQQPAASLKPELKQELDALLPLLPDDWLKMTPEQLKRLKELLLQQPLTVQALTDELLLLQLALQQRVQHLQHLKELQSLKPEQLMELADLLPLLPGLRLSPPQLQRLRDLLQMPPPPLTPHDQEELRVLQRYAEQRAKHLQHLQPGSTLKAELQKELDDLLPLLPKSTGKRQAARQSAQEPEVVAPATKQLIRARRHLG
ncbi:hypothetical protein PRIPAC_86066 [Pristionchus pacificus]|uniref:Uncharacterized protein n=1 Tax=Pristionchus pacificus TaxID=54126 RepID=A0A2A6BU84_PRIPA|nr:hypothetical protein PRIPAC_86066 [Pristionchus pacificus]|eukprot:PDM69470.1 hypothetical protein PRIPAC_44566 [Pristionchus pacificus]